MKQIIIFFGSGDFVIPVIKKIKDHGLILIVSTEKQGMLVDFAMDNNIPFLCSDLSKKGDIEHIKSLDPTTGVLASYGAFVPERVIRAFPNGILNIHPSFLPKYKGPTPVQSTLLDGEKETGVSIIKLDNEIDHGPILAQKKVQLAGNETSEQLLCDLFFLGAEMIKGILTKIEKGEVIEERTQDHSKETFTEKFERNSGKIDLNNPPNAKKLDQMIRAYYPWPGVWFQTRIMNKELRIKLLPEQKIQIEGKKPVSFKDFANGYAQGKEILEKLGINS